MKVSLNLRKNEETKSNNIAFKGYKPTKSEFGFKEYEFAYMYDPDVYNGYLEVFKVKTDNKGNYLTTSRAFTRYGQSKIAIPYDGAVTVDMQETFGFTEDQPFAYHFKLERKDGKGEDTKVDAGDVINEGGVPYNIVSGTKSNVTRGGSMKLVIVDSQNVGYVYNDRNMVVKDENLAKRGILGIKSLTNKYGGTLAGMEHGIEKGDYDAYSRLITLPLFTDDDFSAHGYWNQNCMQMSQSLGNINNYASFQRKLFAHGLNLVSDGAFVNEGLEGTHFGHIQKWGEDSPYLYWFRANGLKDGPLSHGVFAKNKKFISHKIVNSPFSYTQKEGGRVSITRNNKYDKTKPTYIQFFDTRLVTEEEKNDTTSLIKTYSKMSTENVYDLHSHNDSVFPYAFEIRPEVYNKNIKLLNEYNAHNTEFTISLSSPEAARILSKSDYFVVDGKFESGFDTWDANVDIAKLNFVYSNTDAKMLKNLPVGDQKEEMEKIIRGTYQVQDYTITSGQYWTQKTDDILRLYVAQNLKKIDKENPSAVYDEIVKMSDNKIFPKMTKVEVSKDEVLNVINGIYNDKRKLSEGSKKEQIIEGVMNTPLDAIEFGSNLTAVLASPLITKRANTEDEIGVPRYEIYKNGNKNLPEEYANTYKKMDEIFAKDLADYAEKVLNNIDAGLPNDRKLFNGDTVTEYGKYVLPLLLPEITKYAVVKAFAPNITVAINKNTGELAYDYKSMKEVHLQSLGINNIASPEDEALIVLDKLRKGIKKLDSSIDSEIAESIDKTLKDTSVESFKLADLIIDKTQSGLDWRIDATKDIADVEALRNGIASFDVTWDTIIKFWKKFIKAVQDKNPNTYTVAEVTDHTDLHNAGYGYQSRFPNPDRDILSKFLRETGMTALADYSFRFRPISKVFAKDFEDGSTFDKRDYASKMIFDQLTEGGGIVRSGGLDSIMFAYTFIGNHDKPRALHCAALDMKLFYCDLTYNDAGNRPNRRKAYQILEDKFLEDINDYEVDNYDFSGVSPKAIAMADAIRPAFINMLNDYKHQGKLNQETFDKAFIAISKSVSELAGGKFMGGRFNPDAFGTKPIDVAVAMVIKQAKAKHGLVLPNEIDKEFEDKVFESIMKPALSKVLAMMKYLVALPGIPTLFDGDDAGGTGYDTKNKNMTLDGRQKTHEEWITEGSPRYKEFLAKYKKEFDNVMALRSKPECNALNNGAVFTLPINQTQSKIDVAAILRQSTDGRMAISIFNPSGIPDNHRQEYNAGTEYIDKLYLNAKGETVGLNGLRQGLKFVNAKDPNDIYYTRIKHPDGYYLTRWYAGEDVPIKLDDTTLVLYHIPENNIPLTFTGSYRVKPTGNFVVNSYKQKPNETGKNLALLSN